MSCVGTDHSSLVLSLRAKRGTCFWWRSCGYTALKLLGYGFVKALILHFPLCRSPDLVYSSEHFSVLERIFQRSLIKTIIGRSQGSLVPSPSPCSPGGRLCLEY